MSKFFNFDQVVRNIENDLAQMGATDPRRVEKAIVIACLSVAGADPRARREFKKVTEAEILCAVGELRPAAVASQRLEADYSSLSSLLCTLAAFIRGLEALLIEQCECEPVSDVERWRMSTSAGEAFLIPIPGRVWAPSRPDRRFDRTFALRCLSHHRLIPAQIDGLIVRPKSFPGIALNDGTLRLGGALFPDFRTDPPYKTEHAFIITDVKCDKAKEVVDMVLEQSFLNGCTATVFPELTVPPATRSYLQASLQDKLWMYGVEAEDPGRDFRTPAMVLAGTWHEAMEGVVENVATVYSGDGQEILRYAKRLDYQDEILGAEGIESGGELPLLVFDDAIVAVGICLDFCDLDEDIPYSKMSADLVLVPSMGDEGTMDSHLANAKKVGVSQLTRAFVVQQEVRDNIDFIGYVLGAPKAVKMDIEPLKRSSAWSLIVA